MTVMQKARDIYGYLPFEVQKMIAEGMNVPLEKVYGVATFTRSSRCLRKANTTSAFIGTACYVKGSGEIFNKLSEKLGIGRRMHRGREILAAATRCIGACGLAPVMMVNEDAYGKITADDIDKI